MEMYAAVALAAAALTGVVVHLVHQRWYAGTRMADTLRETAASLQTVVEASPVAIVTLTLDGHVTRWNTAAERMFGWTLAELSGNPLPVFESQDTLQLLLDDVTEGTSRVMEQMTCRARDGRPVTARVSTAPLHASDGRPRGLVLLATDLTAQRQTRDELEAAEQWLRLALEASQTGLWRWDPASGDMTFSREWLDLLGYRPGEVPPDFGTFEKLLHPEDRQWLPALLDRYVRDPWPTFAAEYRVRHRDGTHRWLFARAAAVSAGTGRLPHLLGSNVDISERKEAERALEASEQFNRAILGSLSAHLAVLDQEGVIVAVNDAWRSFARAQGDPPRSRVSEGADYLAECDRAAVRGDTDAPKVAAGIRQVLGDGLKEFTFPYPCNTPERDFWFLMRVVPLDRAGGGAVISHEDITDLETARSALEQSEVQLLALVRRLNTARDEERARMARELHDELGQLLTGIKMDLAWMGERLPAGVESLHDRKAAMLELVDRSIVEVRRISENLRPGELDDLGLQAAVQHLVERFRRRTGLPCHLTMPADRFTIDGERSAACYRIVQEALTNVARHAEASQARVRLAYANRTIELEVRDDGQGMTPGQARPRSLGLIGMRERAEALHGTLEIEGTQGEGTTVRARIPMEDL